MSEEYSPEWWLEYASSLPWWRWLERRRAKRIARWTQENDARNEAFAESLRTDPLWQLVAAAPWPDEARDQ